GGGGGGGGGGGLPPYFPDGNREDEPPAESGDPNTSDPGSPATPSTPENGDPQAASAGTPSVPGSGGAPGAEERLPQTGMLWWPVPILAVSGLLLFAFGWTRSQRGEDDEE
ncbi:MAG: hypothetical protein Q4C73_12450, partial [Eubacteriales bacterium]|nr:hypothetical protein [Eubacteriales bacterium]